jgi:hypothetical protein
MRRTPTAVAVASVAAVAAALTLLSGCSSKMSQEDAEKQISSVLESEMGVEVDKVSCPGDIDATEGKTMTCEATAEGETAKVKMTITSVEGDTAKFDVEVVE